LCIYEDYAGLEYGRCIGHGGIPMSVGGPKDPYTVRAGMQNPPPLIPNTKIANDGAIYAHGFAMMTLRGADLKVDYYQDRAPALVYSETF
jgi:hypothetical protein